MPTSAQVVSNNNSDVPETPVKLIFIHHSVGGFWLAHDFGGLVEKLNKDNFYVNDVTYGWEPSSLTDSFVKKIKRKILNKVGKAQTGAYGIGNRTDIGHMSEWFIGPDSDLIMSAVYVENLETNTFGNHSNRDSSTPIYNPDPMTENQIVMFKSCYPNTLLKGHPDDQAAVVKNPILNFAAGSDEHTVANAKRVFNEQLGYFRNHLDKFFVIVTPPPRCELPEDGKIARGFSNWLVHDWLKENGYPYKNVMVFDFYNILTSGQAANKNDAGEEQGNHHRIWKGKVQHIVQEENNLLFYKQEKGNNHPSPAGLQKASQEFVPLLNYYFNNWKSTKAGFSQQ